MLDFLLSQIGVLQQRFTGLQPDEVERILRPDGILEQDSDAHADERSPIRVIQPLQHVTLEDRRPGHHPCRRVE